MITFGTDGWRGIISEDYTFQNVRLVAQAIADYINDRNEQDKGIVVGYDARFLSREYAETCAAVLAASGVNVWLSDTILPTPALTWQVRDRQAAGGVMITASHNPPQYNGLKFKASYGGSASPEIVSEIEKFVRKLEVEEKEYRAVTDMGGTQYFSPQAEYFAHIKSVLDLQTCLPLNIQLYWTVCMALLAAMPRRWLARLALTSLKYDQNTILLLVGLIQSRSRKISNISRIR